MNGPQYLTAGVLIPVIGAPLTALCGLVSKKARNALSLALILSALICSAAILPSVISGKVITASIGFPFGFDFALKADCLAVFMALTSLLIGSVIAYYSLGYMGHYEHLTEYYAMMTLFLGSMTGLVYSSNLIFLYIFWEMTAIASWRLIGFYRDSAYVLKADKAFLVTVGGSLLMFIGFMMLYSETGSFDITAIRTAMAGKEVQPLVAALILAGIFTKSATLPFHTWLPDAGVAPSPVTALLHAAVLVKIGVYVYARLFIMMMPVSASMQTAVLCVAASSALVSAGAALVETDIKRLIAYSTVSQIAFIFLGLASGSEIGVTGALLYILMHGLAKGGLFLSAGIIEQRAGTKDIRKMGGLIRTMPLTAVSFLACSFSVMGIPPFGGFFAKYFVFSGAVDGGHVMISAAFLLGAILTIMYLARLFNMIFMGEGAVSKREGSFTMVSSVVTLAVLSLAGGILISYPFKFAVDAVKQMKGIS